MSINTNVPRAIERRAPLKIQYQQGYWAFLKGWMVNQYESFTVQGQEWQRGWNAGYFDQLDNITNKKA